MKTLLIKINARRPEHSKIMAAAEILRWGGLVAFPTETVYGLGANALDKLAVKKIFEAKGRPADDPLIVHIADKKELYRLAKEVPKAAKKLMDKFWPGPLTIVLKKSKIVPHITTGGLDTVAIRMPAHKIASMLIKEARVPVAAPSANRFGKPSPTSAGHVIRDLGGRVDAVIDGGSASIGVESTVIDMTASPPVLLRPGGVTLEQLKNALGRVRMHPAAIGKTAKKTAAKSPGMKYRHYAPDADLVLVVGEREKIKSKIQELAGGYRKEMKKVGVMTTDRMCSYKADAAKFVGGRPETIARNLFKTFREFDEKRMDVIIAEGIPEEGLGLAVMNRLRRAAARVVRA